MDIKTVRKIMCETDAYVQIQSIASKWNHLQTLSLRVGNTKMSSDNLQLAHCFSDISRVPLFAILGV